MDNKKIVEGLEILEKGILNKYKIIQNEKMEYIIQDYFNLEEIVNSSIINNYINLKNQKIDIIKDIKTQDIIALKLNHINGDKLNIQSFLSNKEKLADIIFLLIELENNGFIIDNKGIYRKDEILNKTNIKSINLMNNIFTNHKGLFIYSNETKKSSNEFLISPFLIELLQFFKNRVNQEIEDNIDKED
jgi:hypothetical protein